MAVRINFGIGDAVLCELSGVSPYEMHTDVDAIIKAADSAKELAGRLGVPPPAPHLYGMSYCHVSALGAAVINRPDVLEPAVQPLLSGPGDIDKLREPDDYLAAGIVPERLALAQRLKAKRPDASAHIGHDYEGPTTTAALLMGPSFFMLAYDEPARACKLLEFCTASSVNYCRALRTCQHRRFGGQDEGIPDDFAGMFPPEVFWQFAGQYWDKLFTGLGAKRRYLHSELLREGHMKFLAQARIEEYDPSVDQYLPPEVVARCCPVKYGLRIWPSMVRDKSADELVSYYRYLAGFKPVWIMFHLDFLANLPKIEALLKVARELEKA